MKQLVFGCLAISVMVAFADTRYVSHSGDYEDSSIWQNRETPRLDGQDAASFGAIWNGNVSAMIPVSVDISLNTETAKLETVAVANQRRESGDADLYPVVLFGNGNALSLSETTGSVTVESLRRVVFDNLKITFGNTGGSGLRFSGDTTLRNGSAITTANGYFLSYANAKTTIDGSSVRVATFAPYAGTSFDLRHGGSLAFTGYYTPEDTAHPERILSQINARVVDGDIALGAKSVYNDGFLPERSGTISAQYYYPKCASDGSLAHRLGGTMRIDSGDYSSGLVATNSVRLYGDGKLYVGQLSCGGFSSRFDLSEFYLRTKPSTGEHFIFGDGVTFGYCGSGTTAAINAGTFEFEGETRLVSTNVATGTSLTSITLGGFNFNPCSGAAVSGGGTVYLTPGHVSDLYAKFEIGDDTAVYNYAQWNETLLAHDFKMGVNSTLAHREGVDYRYGVPTVIGKVQIDPTATLKVSYKELGQRVFASIDDVSAPQIACYNPASVPAGCELFHVGGSYYFATKGWKTIGSPSWCCWKGSADGRWSNGDNWQSKVPGKSAGADWGAHFACFYDGEHQVVACVTNDCADLTLPHLNVLSGAGPHIVRGNTITLTSGLKNTKGTTSYTTGQPPTGSAIVSYSQFPFIVEAPIKATGEYFGVVAGGDGRDVGVVALKGDVEADGIFAPSGHVVVDGKVTASDLELNPIMSDAVSTFYNNKKWRGTVLTVRDGGEVAITDPATSQTTGMVWIAEGGRISIGGDFSWTDADMIHKVDGTFAVAGKLTGTGVETYYGRGSVEIAGIAAGTVAKFGQGVTLVPMDVTTENWTGTIVVDGKMKFAPFADWALPSTLTVARPGSVLEFAGSSYTILPAAPSGADCDIAISGKVAIADDMTVPFATFKKGATLAFMRKANGMIPTLTVDGDVDVTGVTLTGYTDEDSAAMRKVVVLKVPRGCRITGIPMQTDHFKFTVVTDDDGGQSLSATYKRGLMVILR